MRRASTCDVQSPRRGRTGANTVSVAKGPASGASKTPSTLAARYSVPLILLGFVVFTVFVRLPTFFEPPWHTDEGIFQAVAQKVANGGEIYADAWESKPP